MTKRATAPRDEPPGRRYAERQRRGTARPVALSLDAAWLARLDGQRRAGESRSEVVRRAIAALEEAGE